MENQSNENIIIEKNEKEEKTKEEDSKSNENTLSKLLFR